MWGGRMGRLGAVFTETAPVRPGRTRATARRRPILPLYTSCTSSLLIPRVLSTHRPTDGQGHPGDDRFLRYARNDKGIARYDRGCGLVIPASERKSGPERSMTAKAVGGKNIPPPPEASMGQVLAIAPFRFGDRNAPEGTFTCKSGCGIGGPRRKNRGNVSKPAQTCLCPLSQRGRRHKTAPYVLLPLRPRLFYFIWCKQVYRRHFFTNFVPLCTTPPSAPSETRS